MEHGKLVSGAIGVGAWLIAVALDIIQAPYWLGLIFFAAGAGFIITALLWWVLGSSPPRTQRLQGPRKIKPASELARVSVPPLVDADTPHDDRTYIGVTPAYLVGLFKGLTDLQAMPLRDPFLGKWMRVSGPLGNVMSGRETISQATFQHEGALDPNRWPLTVYMYFDRKQWDARLTVLPPGKEITVVGRLKDFDRINVHLENCELED